MKNVTRRNFLKMSGAATLGIAAFPLQAAGHGGSAKQLKIVVVGAHPDDPETGCGGIMILLAEYGHRVISAYLTRGEAGIPGKTHEQAAEIRTNEALEACRMMKVQSAFLNQIDGSCEISSARYEEMYNFLNVEKPDIVFTHWPVDTHRDHRICSVLVYDAWLRSGKRFPLYYYEVMSGEQSQNFYPTHYVDISAAVERKREASYAHKSQDIKTIYEASHDKMEVFRGLEAGYKYAEAYILQAKSPVSSSLQKILNDGCLRN